ncbi:glycosyltransferase [Mangrovibacterium lignilyticum]|uniref:glycosyltransferase n=1 Tax=Mangrovibacterium lignilyticum TaxID=2668052 RepID=UPI0013CFE7D2|nr:glycosyltransferase [Mangrovibacterium lignilyticum]
MVSIIVCTYNREKFIGQCLDSIARQSASSDRFELIFVDNNSTDRTVQLFNDFKLNNPELNCRYFLELNQGLSYARNRGIAESKGDVVAFLDDDAIACEDYVSKLETVFAQSEYGAGGGKILPRWETSRPDWMGDFLLPLVSVIDLGNQQKEFPVRKYPIGANMFFRRSVLKNVGDFNTQLGRVGKNMMGGEEKDIFNRTRAAGVKIGYFPDIDVHHIIPQERTTEAFIRKQALGIGSSESARTRTSFFAYLNRLVTELFKWGATLLISLYYLATFNFSKARMLCRFRFWVTTGLITKQ